MVLSPAKPPLQLAVEELCVAQQRCADALMSVAAYEGADLAGALKEARSAQGRVQAACLALQRAIAERDGATARAGTVKVQPSDGGEVAKWAV